jgi:predicted metal-binding membrane protein
MTAGRTWPARLEVMGLLLAAAAAWWVTAERMAGMDAGPGTDLGPLPWFTGVWTVMMAAMMLPSLAPVVAAYASVARPCDPASALLFAAGYLVVWVLAGLLAYALFALGKDLCASELAWHSGGRWLAASVVGLAALYELSAPKRSFLVRCRDAARAVYSVRCERRSACLATGIRNGGWCVGCSWALMAALFALGIMSVTWMALFATLVALEKLSPRPTAARATTVAVLTALAVWLLVAPDAVPALVVPGGHPAMSSMRLR